MAMAMAMALRWTDRYVPPQPMALFPFKLFRRPEPTAPAALPGGLRVYAVGDVHGRLDRLLMLDTAIRRDMAERGRCREAVMIFLGDYIDRGPDSRGVINVLAKRRFGGLKTRFLLGNHEDALMSFLEDPNIGPVWLTYGGMATLESYGVKLPAERADRMQELSAILRDTIPADHIAFFRSLELFIEIGGFLFVHAGVRPGRDLDRQSRNDLLTIREPFMSARTLPWRVVHGHTVLEQAEFRPARISLDTGAYATGQLSCAVIEGDEAVLLDY